MYKIPANTLFTGQKLIYVPECHSSNTLLYELNNSSPLPEGTVVITDNQTAGRGQRGNTWETEPGLNITFSLLLKPGFLAAKNQFRLNMAVSLGVVEGLKSCVSSKVKLKWPNDIFIDDKKIGGILIENQLQGISLSESIVGMGLNINQEKFSSTGASSIYNFSGKFNDLNEVFQKLVESLEAEYLDLRTGNAFDLKGRYLTSLYKFKDVHHFQANGINFEGVIYDVDEHGRLCIDSEGEKKVFGFKEVKFLN